MSNTRAARVGTATREGLDPRIAANYMNVPMIQFHGRPDTGPADEATR